jgi:hypothetical protein
MSSPWRKPSYTLHPDASPDQFGVQLKVRSRIGFQCPFLTCRCVARDNRKLPWPWTIATGGIKVSLEVFGVHFTDHDDFT